MAKPITLDEARAMNYLIKKRDGIKEQQIALDKELDAVETMIKILQKMRED